jgi:hypothetical protein
VLKTSNIRNIFKTFEATFRNRLIKVTMPVRPGIKKIYNSNFRNTSIKQEGFQIRVGKILWIAAPHNLLEPKHYKWI